MPQPINRQDDLVTQAANLARDTAPDLDVVLITHYPNADTLDTLRPGETDLQTAIAVNRAVAHEMLQSGRRGPGSAGRPGRFSALDVRPR